ncbi:MAG: DNA repair protein RecO [Planctomycetota bacterium]|nr:DNA repair protein RecO [Planctomycetota bacterium]
MPRIKDLAICLRLLDWSETSQIVALLTHDHGKVRGVAKGSKRLTPSSVARYSGGIELLTRGEIVGIVRPTSDLATLVEWDLQEPYHHLRGDLDAQRLAFYAADLANAFLADHDPHPRVFDCLSDLLAALAQPTAQPAARDAALLLYQWRLLEDCGYRPELSRDARTGDDLPDRASYSFAPGAGGFTAQDVVGESSDHRGPGPWRVRRETLDLLRRLAADPRSIMDDNAPAAAALHRRANRLLCVYARAILDRELPTMPFVLDRAEG